MSSEMKCVDCRRSLAGLTVYFACSFCNASLCPECAYYSSDLSTWYCRACSGAGIKPQRPELESERVREEIRIAHWLTQTAEIQVVELRRLHGLRDVRQKKRSA